MKLPSHISAKNKQFYEVSSKNSALKKITLSYFRLKEGETVSIRASKKEKLIHLLAGYVQVKSAKKEFNLGPRKDVFKALSESCFIGINKAIILKAKQDSEILVIKAPGKKTSIQYLSKKDVKVRKVGKGSYFRHVHDVLDQRHSAKTLLAGETFNQPGKWSSYPPHKHDTFNLPKENALEEVYFFRVDPKDSFGIIRVYGEKNGKAFDKTFTVKNNDTVVIPFGYHPVVAPPNTKVYYFWALAGNVRKLRFQADPNFLPGKRLY